MSTWILLFKNELDCKFKRKNTRHFVYCDHIFYQNVFTLKFALSSHSDKVLNQKIKIVINV